MRESFFKSLVCALITASACGVPPEEEQVKQEQVGQLQSALTYGNWVWGGPRSGSFVTGVHFGTGQFLHSCRAPYAGALHVGKVWEGECHVPYATYNVHLSPFETLHSLPRSNPKWVASNAWTSPPSNAVKGGQDGDESQLICSFGYVDGVHPGKLWRNVCYIAWADQAIASNFYDVLVD